MDIILGIKNIIRVSGKNMREKNMSYNHIKDPTFCLQWDQLKRNDTPGTKVGTLKIYTEVPVDCLWYGILHVYPNVKGNLTVHYYEIAFNTCNFKLSIFWHNYYDGLVLVISFFCEIQLSTKVNSVLITHLFPGKSYLCHNVLFHFIYLSLAYDFNP